MENVDSSRRVQSAGAADLGRRLAYGFWSDGLNPRSRFVQLGRVRHAGSVSGILDADAVGSARLNGGCVRQR